MYVCRYVCTYECLCITEICIYAHHYRGVFDLMHLLFAVVVLLFIFLYLFLINLRVGYLKQRMKKERHNFTFCFRLSLNVTDCSIGQFGPVHKVIAYNYLTSTFMRYFSTRSPAVTEIKVLLSEPKPIKRHLFDTLSRSKCSFACFTCYRNSNFCPPLLFI